MADATVEAAMVAALVGESSISDICGDRITPLVAPQNSALPYITYQQISSDRDHVIGGPTGFSQSRYQLNIWATTYNGAKDLFEAVRKFWDGFAGTSSGVVIQDVMSETEADMIAKKPGIDVIDRYGKRFDVIISFTEATS